jgi:hypothetical protein
MRLISFIWEDEVEGGGEFYGSLRKGFKWVKDFELWGWTIFNRKLSEEILFCSISFV